MWSRSKERPNQQRQSGPHQVTHGTAGAFQYLEFGEHE